MYFIVYLGNQSGTTHNAYGRFAIYFVCLVPHIHLTQAFVLNSVKQGNDGGRLFKAHLFYSEYLMSIPHLSFLRLILNIFYEFSCYGYEDYIQWQVRQM